MSAGLEYSLQERDRPPQEIVCNYTDVPLRMILDDLSHRIGPYAWQMQNIGERACLLIYPEDSSQTHLAVSCAVSREGSVTLEDVLSDEFPDSRVQIWPRPIDAQLAEARRQMGSQEQHLEMRGVRLPASDLSGRSMREILGMFACSHELFPVVFWVRPLPRFEPPPTTESTITTNGTPIPPLFELAADPNFVSHADDCIMFEDPARLQGVAFRRLQFRRGE